MSQVERARPARQGVLVIAFGGPHKSEDIRPFLRHVLAGRPVPEERFESVVHHYEVLGGRSPITEHTERQARGLSELLAKRGHPVDVRIGMRHWTPWLKDTLADFAQAGFDEVLGVIMAAQETEASLARYQAAVEAARAELGTELGRAPRVRYVTGWGLSEALIDAQACQLARAMAPLSSSARAGARVLFSAHSIPSAMASESPYVRQLEETARRVAAKVGVSEHRLVYQSRSGNPREPWLTPDVLDALDEEAARGTREVVIAPIGFVCDHVEVLYDLDIEAAQRAEALGIHLTRAATLSAHPSFLTALADAVSAALEAG
ncbi:MAG TPA: ferrochelatase [Polyangiales bacterium]